MNRSRFTVYYNYVNELTKIGLLALLQEKDLLIKKQFFDTFDFFAFYSFCIRFFT